MRQPVEQCRRHLGITKHARPFGEGQIGCDHHTGVLVEFRQQVEEQGSSSLTDVNNNLELTQQASYHQLKIDPPGLAEAAFWLEYFDLTSSLDAERK